MTCRHCHPGDAGSQAIDAAESAAEAVRVLNHATLPAAGGLVWPADVYTVLGSLALVAARLPQAFAQLEAFLEGRVEAAGVRIVDGEFVGDPQAAAAVVSHWLQAATTAAGQLHRSLDAAQNTLTWAAATEEDPDPAADPT